jgi:hypothetical protein
MLNLHQITLLIVDDLNLDTEDVPTAEKSLKGLIEVFAKNLDADAGFRHLVIARRAEIDAEKAKGKTDG